MSEQGAVVWLTGLPASGKTTLARGIVAALGGRPHSLLDSDELRAATGALFGYDDAGRDAFYAMLAGLAAVLARQGQIVVVSATAPRRAHREHARQAAPRMIEVHVATSLDACRDRDPKGLYAAAAADPTSTLPGVGAAYEPPVAPEVIAQGGRDEAAVSAVVAML
jgi:adenylylsulfate kinase